MPDTTPPTPPAGEAPPQASPGATPTEVPATQHTRASAAYVAIAAGLVVLVLVIIFIVQNLRDVSVHFLTARAHMPVGILVLASAVAGGVVVLLVSLARVVQLRLAVRRHRAALQAR